MPPERNRLIDSFGRAHTYLRVSVTDRCNLRCRYCMPLAGLKWKKKNELLSFEEIERLTRIFAAMGVDKVRLTGGEPLMRQDLPTLVEKLAAISGIETVAMTTNATMLAAHCQSLKKSGLKALNISIDSFRPERFEDITRMPGTFEQVMNGIEAAIECGFESLKLNMVVMSGVNDDEVVDFVKYANTHRINARFIEFMPFKDNDWQIGKVVTFEEIKKRVEKEFELTEIPGVYGAVGKDFAITGGGTASFITSMSQSFCSSCNRLRLTSEGSIKSCLFDPGEISLRDALRAGAGDSEIERLIFRALAAKPEAHPPAEEIAAQDNRTMIEIGG